MYIHREGERKIVGEETSVARKTERERGEEVFI